MPEIIVTADRDSQPGDGAVLMRERVDIADFDSEDYAALLVQRLGWAVSDADDAERDGSRPR